MYLTSLSVRQERDCVLRRNNSLNDRGKCAKAMPWDLLPAMMLAEFGSYGLEMRYIIPCECDGPARDRGSASIVTSRSLSRLIKRKAESSVLLWGPWR